MAGAEYQGRNREDIETVLSPGAFVFYRHFIRKRFRSCLNVYYPAVSVFLESFYLYDLDLRAISFARIHDFVLFLSLDLLGKPPYRRVSFCITSQSATLTISLMLLSAPSSQCHYFLQVHAPLPCKTF